MGLKEMTILKNARLQTYSLDELKDLDPVAGVRWTWNEACDPLDKRGVTVPFKFWRGSNGAWLLAEEWFMAHALAWVPSEMTWSYYEYDEEHATEVFAGFPEDIANAIWLLDACTSPDEQPV